MVQIQWRVGAGRFQAHVPFGGRQRLPERQKGLPTGPVRRKGAGFEGVLLPVIPPPQKSGGEGLTGNTPTPLSENSSSALVGMGSVIDTI